MNMRFNSSNPPKKVLIQRADKLGDMVLSFPVIEAISHHFPDTQIDVLASPQNEQIVRSHPKVANVHVYDVFKPFNLKTFLKCIRSIRAREYSLYISLWNHPLCAWLGLLSRIPVRFGDSTHWVLAKCYTDAVDQKWHEYLTHQIDFNLRVLAPLNIPRMIRKLAIYPQRSISHKISNLISSYFNESRPILAMFSSTGGTNFPIPESAIYDFIIRNDRSKSYNIILIGGMEGVSLLSDYQSPSVLNLINRTTIDELVSVIHLASYYMGGDTGPTQIASLMGKPMVFFSSRKPNAPVRWGPQSDCFSIIRKDYDCKYLCMKTCYPQTCFEYVTGPVLEQSLEEVIFRKQYDHGFSNNDRRDYLATQSIRALSVLRSYDTQDSKGLKSIKKHLFVHQMHVDRFTFSTVRQFIRCVLRYNITVVHGDVPKWVQMIVRIYIGAAIVYPPPFFTELPMTSFVSVSDYLRLYRRRIMV